MSLNNFLVMRHELLLMAAALLVLMAEIFTHPERKIKIANFSVIVLAIIALAGFVPGTSGSLFGGMYVTSGTEY